MAVAGSAVNVRRPTPGRTTTGWELIAGVFAVPAQKEMIQTSNATKAQLVVLANALLVLVTSFGVEVSDAQQAGITGFVNAALSVWIGLTYKQSSRRIPDA